LTQQQAASLRRHPLLLPLDLFTLPAGHSADLLFFGGHADHRQGLEVAGQVAVQPLAERQRVGLVVVDPLALLVQHARGHHAVLHAAAEQRAVGDVTQRAGLVATVQLLGQGALLLQPFPELGPEELLGGLRGGVVELAHDHHGIGVHVEAEHDAAIGLANDLLPVRLRVSNGLLCVHSMAGVAHRRSPANTHVIFQVRSPATTPRRTFGDPPLKDWGFSGAI